MVITDKWLFYSFWIEKAFIGNKNVAKLILFSCLNYENDGKQQEQLFSLPRYEIQSLVPRRGVGLAVTVGTVQCSWN